MKLVYNLTYHTGEIYIGKDNIGIYRYYGIPGMEVINKDFESLPKEMKFNNTNMDILRNSVIFATEL
jgi:hypothetical protein